MGKMAFTQDLNEPGNNVSLLGGKGNSLAELTRVGLPVPPGFVILSKAFDNFIEHARLGNEIDSILSTVNPTEQLSIKKASENLTCIILNSPVPEEIAVEIQKSLRRLGSKLMAVRSSATAEDGFVSSWAGQFESFLNTTEETLLDNVKKCWASLFTERAISYRFAKKLQREKISMAVIVQKMINSEVSGVAFSINPLTKRRDSLVIEACSGLGTALVSGQVTPDNYLIEKKTLQILGKKIPQGEEQKLSDSELVQLSKLVMKIEEHYGFPVDVEWAIESKTIYVLQSRPITGLMLSK